MGRKTKKREVNGEKEINKQSNKISENKSNNETTKGFEKKQKLVCNGDECFLVDDEDEQTDKNLFNFNNNEEVSLNDWKKQIENKESENEEEDEIEEKFDMKSILFSKEYCKKFLVAVIISILCGIVFIHFAVQSYEPNENCELPTKPRDAAIRTDFVHSKGEITIMWEPSREGVVDYYRIFRESNLGWQELEHSPTDKLGTKDKNLPVWVNSHQKLTYRIYAENSQNRSLPTEVWFYLPPVEFDLATTSRAPRPPSNLTVEDISFEMGKEELLLRWNKPTKKVLSYTVYILNRINNQYDEIGSIKNGEVTYFHYPIHVKGQHCFVMKANSWGDIGVSAPSPPTCITIQYWLWEIAEMDAEEIEVSPHYISDPQIILPII